MFFLHFILLLGIASLIGTNLVPKILSGEDQLLENPTKSLYLFYHEDLSDSGRAFFSLFSKIYMKIKDDPSYKISNSNFEELKKFYASESLEFMRIIRAFHDKSIVLLACLLLSADNTNYYNFGEWLFDRKRHNYISTTRKIFEIFNDLIGMLFMKPYPNPNIEEKEKILNERKKTAKIMISILQQVNNSKFNFILSFPMRIFTTRDYIRIMTRFIDGIMTDSLAGAQVVFFKLKQFRIKHSGKIPVVEPFQEEIYSLLLLWRLYVRHITYYEYNEVCIESLDPIFLAQFIAVRTGFSLENIFPLFGENQIVTDALHYLYGAEVWNLPRVCVNNRRRIGNIGPILNYLEIEKENREEKALWNLKVYVKLLRSLKERIR
jgi:hypothetical protein